MKRSRVRVFSTFALAAALLGTVLPTVASSAAAAPVTPVVPSALPMGPATKPAARIVGKQLLRPGKSAVSLAPYGNGVSVSPLFRAKGGYLIYITRFEGRPINGKVAGYRIIFISDSGRKREVARLSPYKVTAVAPDGRTFIGSKTRYSTKGKFLQGAVLRRIRLSDGRPVGSTLTIAGYPDMIAVTAERALMGYVPLNGRHDGEPRTVWWSTQSGRVRVVAANPKVPPGMPDYVQGASLGAHAFSVIKHGRQVVLDTRTGDRLWKTFSGEAVRTFSPDGKKVVSVAKPLGAGHEEGDGYLVRRLYVRNARTGRLLVTFTGYFRGIGLEEHGAPSHWESADSYFTYGHDTGFGPDDWPASGSEIPIRCRVSTSTCERVPDTSTLKGTWVTPKSS